MLALPTTDGNVANTATVFGHKPFQLHKHPARTTAGIIDPACHTPRRVRSGLEHSRHRSFKGFISHVLAVVTAYAFRTNKPRMSPWKA